MITPEGKGGIIGELADLSAHGAAIVLPELIARGTRVSILIDPSAIADLKSDRGLPSLPGVVINTSRADHTRMGEMRYRLSVELNALPEAVTERLREMTRIFARGSSPPADAEVLTEAHSQSARGRESLFQGARARLEAGDPATASRYIAWALSGEPRNAHYHALARRAAAEAAIAEGNHDLAAREIAFGLEKLPGAPDLLELQARLLSISRPKKGLFSRLLGR